MKHILASLVVLALGYAQVGSAADPSAAYLSADRACSVIVQSSGSVTTNLLSEQTTASDGEKWYGGTDRAFLRLGGRFSAAVTGYLTSWYSYDQAPASMRDEGPSHLTQLLGSSQTLEMTSSVTNALKARFSAPTTTDLYAKFTPITYLLAYALNEGGFREGDTHPSSATYDVAFDVSAPQRTGHAFAGWKVNGTTYFEGETATVTFQNLTVTNGATVTLAAQWVANGYPLKLVVGEGVAKVTCVADGVTNVTTKTTSVPVAYGSIWKAWAEPAYGYAGSGAEGWSGDRPETGVKAVGEEVFSPVATRLPFALTVLVSPSDGGTASGGGSYAYLSTNTVSATAAAGYAFSSWSDGATENPHAVTILCATNLTANFTAKTYRVQLYVGTGVRRIFYRFGGTGDYLPTNASCTLYVPYKTTYEFYCEPADGYEMSGPGSSRAVPFAGTVGAADMSYAPEPSRRAFAVSASADPSAGGSVSGAGSYSYGTSAELTATPASGYRFVSWDDGSTENPRTLTVTGETVLRAKFEAAAYTLTLTVPAGAQTLCYRVGGHGAYTRTDETVAISVPFGATYEYYVEPAEGYSVSGSGASAERPKTGTMGATPTSAETPTVIKGAGANTLMLAVGEGVAKIHWWTDLTSVWSETTVSTTLTFTVGTTYRVYADAAAGYTLSGAGSSIGSYVSGTISESGAVFAPAPVKNSYLITVQANPTSAGTTKVSGDGRFSFGERAKAEANAYTGWIFDHWTDVTTALATNVSSNAIYDFTVTGNATLEAVFVQETYTVAFVYKNADGVEVKVSQEVAFGEKAVEPTPEVRNNWVGHAFSSWDRSDWERVTGDATIYAEYAANTYTIRFDPVEGSGSMPDQTFTYDQAQALSKCSFTRTGYTFAGWTSSRSASASDAAPTYTDQQSVLNLLPSGTLTLYAVWTPKTYTITFAPGVATGDSYTKELSYDELYSLPNNPFQYATTFLGWKVDAIDGATYTNGEQIARLTSGDAITLVAKYAKGSQVMFHANWTDEKGLAPYPENVVQYFESGVENALKANTFTRPGYTFAGWSSSRSASASDATTSRSASASDAALTYADQQLVNSESSPIASPGTTLDLYAIWKPNTYQVIFDANKHPEYFDGGTNPPPIQLTYDQSVTNILKFNIEKYPGAYQWFLGMGTNVSQVIIDFSEKDERDVRVPLLNLTEIPNDHIRLYAIWSDSVSDPSPTLAQSAASAVVASAASLVDAAASPRLTTASEPTWTNDGWAELDDGVYSNGVAVATLSTTIATNGTLTFDWMPSAVGDADVGTVLAPKIISAADRLSSAVLSVTCGGNPLTKLTGQTVRDWTAVTVPVENVSRSASLAFVSNAKYTDEHEGVYPVMIRNVVWTPAGEPIDPTVTNTVTFVCSNVTWTTGGSATYSTNVTQHSEVTLPAVTVNVGYTFDGWYDAANQRIDTPSVTVTTDLTLTAIATNNVSPVTPVSPTVTVTNTYNVNFRIDSAKGASIGRGGCVDRVTVVTNASWKTTPAYGQALEPTVVGVNGWDFAGWAVDAGPDILPNAICNQPITADTTFVAVFTPHVYTNIYANVRSHNNSNPATFESTNGRSIVANGVAVDVLTYRPLTPFGTETQDGAFTNWNPTALSPGVYGWTNELTGVFNYTNVVTQAIWVDMVKAKETNPVYTVTFASGEGSSATAELRRVEEGKNVTDLPTPAAKHGYVFTGWSDSPDKVTGDRTLTAQYEAIRYPITYANLKGATHDNPSEYTIGDFANADHCIRLNDPRTDNTDIRFGGWTVGRGEGAASTGPTNCIPADVTNDLGAITVTANWAYRITFSRTADAHVTNIVGQVGNASTTSGFVADGGSTNLPAFFCAPGYSPAGWQSVDAGPCPRQTGTILSNITSSVTLSAVATANVYVVRFDGNGATSGAMADQSFTYDVAQALAKNAFAKEGSSFKCWTNRVDACGKSASTWADGEVVQNLATGGGVDLFAVWETLPVAPTSAVIVIDGTVRTEAVGTTITNAAPFDGITVAGTNVVCTGWIGSGDVPASGTGTQVVFTVSQGGSLKWLYQTNYWVSVGCGQGPASTCEGGTVTLEDAVGTVIANAGWHPAGQRLVAVASPAAGWRFAGWTCAAPAPVDAGSCPRQEDLQSAVYAFNVAGATALTAVFEKIGYTIAYLGLEGATHTNTNGFTVDDEFAFTAPSARTGWKFLGWDPSGIATGTTDDVVARASWARTYSATFELGEHLTRTGGGELVQTVTEGACAAAPEVRADRGYQLQGWVDSSGARVGTEGFRVTYDVTFRAIVEQTWHKVTIDGVEREVASGETLTVSTAASVTNGLTNVVCVGWIGTGSVPASGTSNTATFAVTNASSLTWLYETNYWVAVDADAASSVDANFCSRQNEDESSAVGRDQKIASTCEGGSVTLCDATGHPVHANPGWFLAGTNLVAEATPAEGWLFAHWTPTLQQSDTPTIRQSFTVLSPVALTAVFTQKVVRTVFDVAVAVADGCEKMGTVSGAKKSVKPGTKVTVKATAKSGYLFAGWYADAESASTLVSQSASYSFAMPTADVVLEALFIAKGDDWAEVSVGETEPEYAKGIAIDPIAVSAAGGSLPTVKVTGLPTGLKFTATLVTAKQTTTVGGKRVTTLVTNALPNTIYGTPTRSGVYTAKVTATTLGKATATTNVTFIVVDRDAGEQVVATTVALVDGVVPGKTTGQGVYKAGKKVTLKATANTGYVFSGWYDDTALVSRLASLALVVPDHDLAYTAAFVTTEDDAASISASVNGMAVVDAGLGPHQEEEESSASTGLTVITNVSAGVYLEWPVAADALSATTVAVSGLPSGLKFTAKPVTSRVTTYDESGKRVYVTVTNVPAMTIYGTPTTASKVNARTGEVTPSQVKVTVTTAGRNKVTGVIKLTVDALPTALVGTYVGGSVDANFCSRQDEEDSSAVGRDQKIASTEAGSASTEIGSATITLASTGKISGKWISEGLTWTLTATGFDAVTSAPEGRRTTGEGGSAYTATVTAKSGTLAETLTLVFSVNELGYGTVDAGLCPRQEEEESASTIFSATYVPWKTDADLKALAKELKGKKFTVDANFCSRQTEDESSASDAEGLRVSLQGTVGANGTVSVKGTFAVDATSSSRQTSYTATVSSTLVPIDEDGTRFSLFLYYPYKKNKFDGYTTTLTLVWDGESLRPLNPNAQ